MRVRPGPEDPQLIVIAEQSGQMFTPDFRDPLAKGLGEVTSVPVVEHYILLQNVITDLSKVSQLSGYIKLDDGDIRRGQTHMPPARREAVANRISQSMINAKQAFARATGSTVLKNAYTNTEMWQNQALPHQMFSDFTKKYFGPRHYEEAQAYRRKLINNTRILQWNRQTALNRDNQQRPHEVITKPAGDKTVTPENRYLNTQQRMKIIVEDPRAGFLPTTNREKNQVITFLDYLDNPKFRFNVNSQFLEVFTHTQTVRRNNPTADSSRGPLSITYELGDYLKNATKYRQALEEIELLLIDMPNLRVSLGDERENLKDLKLNHPGFVALMRYKTLTQYMDTGVSADDTDPLLTKEDRWTKEGPGQHKIVEDIYTGSKRTPAYKARVTRSVAKMEVGEARQLIGPAIADQIKRESCMTQLLELVATPPTDLPRSAKQILEQASLAAHEILDKSLAA